MIIEHRLKLEDDFLLAKSKKSLLWSRILTDCQRENDKFPFSKDEVQKKFNNLFVTYKRIKQRINEKEAGGKTNWEYFTMFDNVYGKKKLINFPLRNANNVSSSNFEASPIVDTEMQLSSDDSETEIIETVRRKKRKIAKINGMSGILEFLIKEAKEKERRHQELLTIEKDKIKIMQELNSSIVKALLVKSEK